MTVADLGVYGMQVMTGGEALARQLAAEGVSQVFGLPGVQLDYALDGLATLAGRVRFLSTRHEQAAAYMADGYARSSGEPGVFMVVPGPGLLNAAAGLATAYACSSPVLCICGQVPSWAIGRGYGMLHEIPDQTGILRALTKWAGFASAPGQIPGLVHEAFRQMRSGRPRPVAIEVPPDVLEARAGVDILPPAGAAAAQPDPDLLGKAAAVLDAAQRPVICAGGGVVAAGATEALRLLAETLQAPVVMSANGRGALPDSHRLALTSLAGPQILSGADAVLAVGTRFRTPGGHPLPAPPGAAVIHLNADPKDLATTSDASLRICGDAGLGLAGLLDRIASAARPSRTAEIQAARRWCGKALASLEPQMSWVRALRAAIPGDGILVSEFTQVGYVARVAYPVYQPRTYLGPGYQGTLGYGFPTALGAKAAKPEVPVVSITGDGGFGYSLQELSTARKYGIGLVTVVFSDGAYGNVRRDQRDKFGGRLIGTSLHNPDFTALARDFGIAGQRATTPGQLTGTLREALSGHEPVLIEVPVGEMPSPWPLIGRSGTTTPAATAHAQ